LGIKGLGNPFVGSTNYWEKPRKTKVGKRVFWESCIGKKPWEKLLLGKITLGKTC